jgi:hypothetical protein
METSAISVTAEFFIFGPKENTKSQKKVAS